MNLLKILIGGCSRSGKSTAAQLLSEYLGITYYSLDKMRDSLRNPVSKALDSPEAWDNDVESLIRIIKQKSAEARSIVEKWRISTQSGVFEGEGIEPAMVNEMGYTHNLKVIYVIETDTERLHTTLQDRSKKYRDLSEERQKKVVAMDAEYSKFIQTEAVKFDQPRVYSQPWNTICDRILKAIWWIYSMLCPQYYMTYQFELVNH